MNKSLQLIREKCIAAHGGFIGTMDDQEPASERVFDIAAKGDPIRLADVLLASIGKGIAVNTIGVFISDEEGMMPRDLHAAWNLRADDLDKQNDKTIQFIYSLLT